MTVRLSSCCDNLNQSSPATVRIGEDVNTTVTVTTSSTTLLPANATRRLIKLFVISQSDLNAEISIRYGASASPTNSAHPLPPRYLLIIDTAQAQNAISAICSSGIAQVRVSAANIL